MKANTISGDRCRLAMTIRAKCLQCVERRFESAAVDGRNNDDATRMEVKRNVDRFRTKSGV
jgi:hypothetical protein